MLRKYLTDEQYQICMNALGYTYDEQLDKFFKGDSCFLGNVEDTANDVGDLMKINDKGHPTYMANVLCEFMNKGAKLIIGEGAIDDYGVKHKKGLYCINYRELFSENKSVRSK